MTDEFLRETCDACGLTAGAHCGGPGYNEACKKHIPYNYCPGHQGRMDWNEGPGTIFVPSGRFADVPYGMPANKFSKMGAFITAEIATNKAIASAAKLAAAFETAGAGVAQFAASAALLSALLGPHFSPGQLYFTRKRTLRERWIEPILHPITVPFEPWVKTKTERAFTFHSISFSVKDKQ